MCRVSDPYSFDPDPDPAFEAGDQSGSGSGSRALKVLSSEIDPAEIRLIR